MASEKGPVATEAPPFSSPTLQAPVTTLSVETIAAEAARASQSLKRQREATPTSPSSVLPPTFSSDLSPSKAARIAGLASRHSPAPMTGAAALEDERRRDEEEYRLQVSGASENPAYRAQTALMSANALAMSRPEDEPSSTEEPSDPTSSLTGPIPNIEDSHAKIEGNSESASNIDNLDSVDTALGTSPRPMDLDANDSQPDFGAQSEPQMGDRGPTSLSYPGVLAASNNMPAPPTRGMSMPMTPNTQTTPRSPNSKKHKCPHCETEFTRHHNLKSHLLTHSQEKPYVCQNCTMRFRRLHDLKRHSKLHTGEKPHVCPKCDRKFARGDALARHSKGPGGCVGRRSSMGSYLGEEDPEGVSRLSGDDSAMAGVIYDGSAAETDMTEEEKRRLSSVPSIKAQHVDGQGRLFPPNTERASASSNASHTPGTSISSLPLASGVNSASIFAQTGISESPKPLSPGLQAQDGTSANRPRSPSLTTQFQQQHFGRHQPDRQTPPVPGFSAADAARYAASAATAQATSSQLGSGQPVLGSTGSSHTRTPSAPGQNGGSGDSTNNIFATDQGIWAYINNLEEQVRLLNERVQLMETSERAHEDKIANLENEVTVLRSQIDSKQDVIDKID